VHASPGLTHCARENKGKNPLDKIGRCMLPSGESFPHESRRPCSTQTQVKPPPDVAYKEQMTT
jgi:hypothetical protein